MNLKYTAKFSYLGENETPAMRLLKNRAFLQKYFILNKITFLVDRREPALAQTYWRPRIKCNRPIYENNL